MGPVAGGASRGAKTLSLINNMLNVIKGRLMAKIRSKEPPHPAECFAKPPAENVGGHKKTSSWWPPRPPGLRCTPSSTSPRFARKSSSLTCSG